MWHKPRKLAAWLIVALTVSRAHATDTVISSVSGTHFSGNDDEAAVSLSLQHGMDHGGFIVGVSGTEFPIGSLTEVDLDGYAVQSARFAVTGGVSVGDAVSSSQSDTLYKARLFVDSQLAPAWLVHAGYQFIELDLVHGNLLTASLEYRPATNWGIKGGGGYTVHGTLADRYGNVELNWYGPQHLFAGVVLGSTGYDPAELGQISVIQRLFQIYLGASVPVSFGTLTMGVDTLSLEGTPRQTLRFGLIEPIKP